MTTKQMKDITEGLNKDVLETQLKMANAKFKTFVTGTNDYVNYLEFIRKLKGQLAKNN